jgi:hypothetical protein
MEDLRASLASETGQSTEVDRVVALVMKAIEGDVRRMAESLVLKRDDELLGRGEFELRQKVLGMACHILEATINDRKKGGTKAAASSAPTAAKTRGSSGGGPGRS